MALPENLSEEALSKIVELDAVVNIVVDESILVRRITGRRMCKCGATFHVDFNPPKSADTCDQCGAQLYQRDDDKEETVLQRLEVYRSQTEPLVEYYGRSGIVHDFDGNGPIDRISSEIITFLSKLEG